MVFGFCFCFWLVFGICFCLAFGLLLRAFAFGLVLDLFWLLLLAFDFGLFLASAFALLLAYRLGPLLLLGLAWFCFCFWPLILASF